MESPEDDNSSTALQEAGDMDGTEPSGGTDVTKDETELLKLGEPRDRNTNHSEPEAGFQQDEENHSVVVIKTESRATNHVAADSVVPSLTDAGSCVTAGKSEESLSLGMLKKDDSGIYSEKSPKECSDLDASESISESLDDSGGYFGVALGSDFSMDPEDRLETAKGEIDDPEKGGNSNILACDDEKSSESTGIPEAAVYMPARGDTKVQSKGDKKATSSDSVSIATNDSESNPTGSLENDIDAVTQSETADCDNDDESTVESEMFRRKVNRSKFHKRVRRVSSSSDSSSDSSESESGLGRLRRSYRLNSDDEDEDGSDDSDGKKDDKKSTDSDEDEDKAMEATDLRSPKHKYRALFDIRNREYGYANSVRPHLFRQKIQGSLQMVQRFLLQYKMDHHEGCVNALHFNRIGTLLASGSDDLNIVLWNWIRQRPALEYDSGHRSNVFQAKFMPFSGDCHVVSCARDGQVRLADLSLTGVCKGTKKLAQHKGAAHKLALELDSPHIFLSCGEDAVTYEIDLREDKANKLVTTKENDRKVAMYSIHSNPVNSFEFCVAGRDHFIRIYDKRRIAEDENNGILKKFCPHHLVDSDVKANVTCACYNYNGTEVLGTYNDEDIYLFNNLDSDGANYIHKYCGHRNNQTVKGVNFYGPESEFIVSGSDCGHIFLWDKETEKIVQFMEGDEGGVINVLEPHPYSPVLATSGLDHDVKIWAPTAEKPTELTGLRKVMKRNQREREEERTSAPDMLDGQMLWFLMHQLRRPRRRLAREANQERGEGDMDEDSTDSDSDDSPTLSEDSEGGPLPERISCNPS